MGLTAALIFITTASAVVSYDAQRTADKRAREQAKAEQEILNKQADEEERKGDLEAKHIRDTARKIKGQQTAGLGASGVKIFEGTGSDLLTETDTLSEFDALEAIKDSQFYAGQLRKKSTAISAPQYADSVLLEGALDIGKVGVWSYGKYKNRTTRKTTKTDRNSLLNSDASGGSMFA